VLQILGNGGAVDLLCSVVLVLNARQSGEIPDRADPVLQSGFVDVIVIRWRIWIADGHDVVINLDVVFTAGVQGKNDGKAPACVRIQ